MEGFKSTVRFLSDVAYRHDPKGVEYVMLNTLRLIWFFCFLLAHSSMVPVFDEIPLDFESASFDFVYIKSVHPYGARKGSGIPFFKTVEGGFYHVYGTKNAKILEGFVGEKVKVWSYEKYDRFFFVDDVAVEVEVGGDRLFGDWEVVRNKSIIKGDFYRSVVLYFISLSSFLLMVCLFKADFFYSG